MLGFVAADESLAKDFSEAENLKPGALLAACADPRSARFQRMVRASRIDPSRPLIICDADEVLVQFIVGLERFLERRACYTGLDVLPHSRQRQTPSHRRARRRRRSHRTRRGVLRQRNPHSRSRPRRRRSAATSSASDAQIVILSNLPEVRARGPHRKPRRPRHRLPGDRRQRPKGPIVKRLIGDHARPVVFIDDLPPHSTSVAAETPHVHRLHFIADHAPRPPACRTRPTPTPHRRLARSARRGSRRVIGSAMMRIGVDLGGTKIEIAALDPRRRLHPARTSRLAGRRLRRARCAPSAIS